MKGRNEIRVGCLCALGCEVLFGLSYVLTKQATETAGAFQLLGWRFLIAFVVMSLCAALGFVKLDLRGKRLTPLLLIALFNPVICFTGETIGISRTSASESGVFLACIPVVSLLAGMLLLGERLTPVQWLGAGVIVAGIYIANAGKET